MRISSVIPCKFSSVKLGKTNIFKYVIKLKNKLSLNIHIFYNQYLNRKIFKNIFLTFYEILGRYSMPTHSPSILAITPVNIGSVFPDA